MLLSTLISVQAVELKPIKADTDLSVTDASATDASATSGKEAKDLGVYGEVFPVGEKSLIEVIQEKLQALKESGELENHQKAIAAKTKDKVMHPEPVAGLHKATKPRSFSYDPSIMVPYDLKDHEGQVFHHKGTKVNPLDTHAFKSPFLFLDGDDPDQVNWATKEHRLAGNSHKPKIVLVKGAPFELSKQLNIPVYFDQSGALVKKFGIEQIPARVSQQDKVLFIEELILEEEK